MKAGLLELLEIGWEHDAPISEPRAGSTRPSAPIRPAFENTNSNGHQHPQSQESPAPTSPSHSESDEEQRHDPSNTQQPLPEGEANELSPQAVPQLHCPSCENAITSIQDLRSVASVGLICSKCVTSIEWFESPLNLEAASTTPGVFVCGCLEEFGCECCRLVGCNGGCELCCPGTEEAEGGPEVAEVPETQDETPAPETTPVAETVAEPPQPRQPPDTEELPQPSPPPAPAVETIDEPPQPRQPAATAETVEEPPQASQSPSHRPTAGDDFDLDFEMVAALEASTIRSESSALSQPPSPPPSQPPGPSAEDAAPETSPDAAMIGTHEPSDAAPRSGAAAMQHPDPTRPLRRTLTPPGRKSASGVRRRISSKSSPPGYPPPSTPSASPSSTTPGSANLRRVLRLSGKQPVSQQHAVMAREIPSPEVDAVEATGEDRPADQPSAANDAEAPGASNGSGIDLSDTDTEPLLQPRASSSPTKATGRTPQTPARKKRAERVRQSPSPPAAASPMRKCRPEKPHKAAQRDIRAELGCSIDCKLGYFNPDAPEVFIEHVLTRILLLFEPSDLELLLDHLAELDRQWHARPESFAHDPMSMATGCAGSDNIIDWGKWLGKRINRTFQRHKFSADISQKCRNFINRRHPDLDRIYSDVQKLGGQRAVNTIAPGLRPDMIPEVAMWIFGFVCTDISSRNQNSRQHRDTCAKGDGRTGSTWAGCHSYTDIHRPEHGVGENVRNLCAKSPASTTGTEGPTDDDSSNLKLCQSNLASSGYASIAVLASPHQFFIPEIRSPSPTK